MLSKILPLARLFGGVTYKPEKARDNRKPQIFTFVLRNRVAKQDSFQSLVYRGVQTEKGMPHLEQIRLRVHPGGPKLDKKPFFEIVPSASADGSNFLQWAMPDFQGVLQDLIYRAKGLPRSLRNHLLLQLNQQLNLSAENPQPVVYQPPRNPLAGIVNDEEPLAERTHFQFQLTPTTLLPYQSIARQDKPNTVEFCVSPQSLSSCWRFKQYFLYRSHEGHWAKPTPAQAELFRKLIQTASGLPDEIKPHFNYVLNWQQTHSLGGHGDVSLIPSTDNPKQDLASQRVFTFKLEGLALEHYQDLAMHSWDTEGPLKTEVQIRVPALDDVEAIESLSGENTQSPAKFCLYGYNTAQHPDPRFEFVSKKEAVLLQEFIQQASGLPPQVREHLQTCLEAQQQMTSPQAVLIEDTGETTQSYTFKLDPIAQKEFAALVDLNNPSQVSFQTSAADVTDPDRAWFHYKDFKEPTSETRVWLQHFLDMASGLSSAQKAHLDSCLKVELDRIANPVEEKLPE